MAYITVTTLADLIDPIDGKVSLREAVAQANAGDIIRFALNLEGGPPLVLTQGELAITRDLTIDGDRNDDGVAVTIEGGAKSRDTERYRRECRPHSSRLDHRQWPPRIRHRRRYPRVPQYRPPNAMTGTTVRGNRWQ